MVDVGTGVAGGGAGVATDGLAGGAGVGVAATDSVAILKDTEASPI